MFIEDSILEKAQLLTPEDFHLLIYSIYRGIPPKVHHSSFVARLYRESTLSSSATFDKTNYMRTYMSNRRRATPTLNRPEYSPSLPLLSEFANSLNSSTAEEAINIILQVNPTISLQTIDDIYNNPDKLPSLSLFNYLPDELLIPYGEEQCKYMNLTPPAATLPRMEYIHELNKKGIV